MNKKPSLLVSLEEGAFISTSEGEKIITLTPESIFFTNTIRKGWFGLFKEIRVVYLRWIIFNTKQGESFSPILEDSEGFQIPNQQIAESYLGIPIDLPKIISVVKSLSFSGNCEVCERFHLEYRDTKTIRIIGEEGVVLSSLKNIELGDEIDPLYTKCTDHNCRGRVEKKLVLT